MPLKLMTLHRYFLPTYIISVLTKTYIDMTNNESILDGCKGLVMHCDCSVLILNVMVNIEYTLWMMYTLKLVNVALMKSVMRKT